MTPGYADAAMESQSKFVESLRKQYEERGTLSEKQIEVFEKIIEQIESYQDIMEYKFSNANDLYGE